MHLDIASKHLDLTPPLRSYIEEKIGGIAKFIEPFDLEGGADCKVTVERATAHHHKGEVFRAVADLRFPGAVLRAEEFHEDARAAIDEVRRKLLAEIETHKGKMLHNR